MAHTLENFVSGMPVAIDRIDRQLKALWEEGGDFATRASLMNLALYCEREEATEANTKIIAEITRDHACRAILIAAKPGAPEPHVQAWVNAHCHISRAGAKQVCCEQITFLIEGDVRRLIPNIVFAHLDSDLPLYLWWQEPFADRIDSQFLTWVDRLIYDSHQWGDPASELAILRGVASKTASRLTLCDLNWARSLLIRQTLARIFDDPASMAFLDRIDSIELVHGKGFRTTALLLIAWLMTQLKWTFVSKQSNRYELSGPSGGIAATLKEQDGICFSECSINADRAGWRVSRDVASGFLHVQVCLPEGPGQDYLIPARGENIINVLSDELSRGSRHVLYTNALDAFEQLL